MRNFTFIVVLWLHFPDLFHANTEFWHIGVTGEVVFGDNFLGERSTHTLRNNHIFAVENHTRLIGVARRAVRVFAKLARDNTFNSAIFIIHKFRTGHARIDFNAHRLRLLGQPTTNIPHRNDVIAVVVHQRWHDRIWNTNVPGFAKEIKVVFLDLNRDRRAFFFPIRDQRVQAGWIKHRARQNMRADFRPFFKHDNHQVFVKLFQADRSRKTGRASPHDHHIHVHCFAFNLGHLDPLRNNVSTSIPVTKGWVNHDTALLRCIAA